MNNQELKEIHLKKLKKLQEDILNDWEGMLDDALRCGGISEDMKDPNNFLLAKAIIWVWCKNNNFEPVSVATRREFANLSFFI